MTGKKIIALVLVTVLSVLALVQPANASVSIYANTLPSFVVPGTYVNGSYETFVSSGGVSNRTIYIENITLVSIDNVSQKAETHILYYAVNSTVDSTYGNWSFFLVLSQLGILNLTSLNMSNFTEDMEKSGFTNVSVAKNVTYRVGSVRYRIYNLSYEYPPYVYTTYVDSFSGLILHSYVTQKVSGNHSLVNINNWTVHSTNVPTTASNTTGGLASSLYRAILSPLVLIFIGLIVVLCVATFYFRRSRTKN